MGMVDMVAIGFGVLPPEVNSGLMYAGPGVGPMLTAATSWDRLASELFNAASSYDGVIEGLTADGWSGPSANQFTQAMIPYIAWLRSTGVCAEQAAAQLRQAASAYEVAHRTIVPPAVVAANRAELIQLINHNTLGQNTPAIEANWARYYGMWAEDAAVMDGYANATSPVTQLKHFTPPPPVTTSNKDLTDLAPAAAATGSATAKATHVGFLTLPANTPPMITQGVTTFQDYTGISNLEGLANYGIMPPRLSNYIMGITNGAHGIATRLANAAAKAAAKAAKAGAGAAAAAGAAATAMPNMATLAGFGQSATVGTLSVPMSWAAASPVEGISGSTLASSLSSALGHIGTGASNSVNVGGLLNSVPPLVGTTTRTMASAGPMTLPRLDVATHVVPLSPAAG